VGLGCSQQPGISQLRGQVTLDGRPVSAGRVIVVSADDRNSASGELAADGTYQIINAPAGEIRLAVQVQPYRYTTVMGAPPKPKPGAGDGGSADHVPAEVTGGMRPNPQFVAIPERYESIESSGLTALVPQGDAVHDIVLTGP
jgi:hypothetical protein